MESLSTSVPPQSRVPLLSTILTLVILGSLSYYLIASNSPLLKYISYSTLKKTSSNQVASPTTELSEVTVESTPTPIPLPSGIQSYDFSQGDQVKGPKVTKIVYDPLTPLKGQTQKVTIVASYTVPITEATLTIVSDYLITPHILTLTSGTSTNGTWSGQWIMEDTIDTRYAGRTTLKSSVDTHDTAMWFRNQ